MTNRNSRSTTDQILDLLLDALIERQKARRTKTGTGRLPTGVYDPAEAASAPRKESSIQSTSPETSQPSSVPSPRPEPPPSEQQRPITAQRSRSPRVVTQPPPEPKFGEEGWPALGRSGTEEPPPRQPSINMGKMIGRLALLVIVLLILVNIPVTRYGVSLARILPETTSLIVRDGLVLKGSGPEIYVLEEDKLRWISSMDAFEHMGLTWEDVHIVEDDFLAKFEKGRPIHVLLKCRTSPHIYRLENQEKRWIKDIDTFIAEGHVWEDVRFVSCTYLQDIPDGPPIPEDAGPPPEP